MPRFAKWGPAPPPDNGLRWAAFGTLAVMVATAAVIFAASPGVGVVAHLLLIGCPTWLVIFARRRGIRRRLGSDVHELPVSASYRWLNRTIYGGEAYTFGSDDGLLTLVDGWLLFRGDRTEWSVRTSDVRRETDGFRYDGPGGRYEAGLSVIGADNLVSSLLDTRRGRKLLDEWGAAPVPDGPPMFPPAEAPPPGEPAGLRWWVIAGILIVGGLASLWLWWIGLVVAAGLGVLTYAILASMRTEAVKAEGFRVALDAAIASASPAVSESSTPSSEAATTGLVSKT